MNTVLRKVGNSKGVIIPKPLLAEVGLTREATLTVESGAIVLRPVSKSPREGWAEASRAVAQAGDDALVWPEFGNEADEGLVW